MRRLALPLGLLVLLGTGLAWAQAPSGQPACSPAQVALDIGKSFTAPPGYTFDRAVVSDPEEGTRDSTVKTLQPGTALTAATLSSLVREAGPDTTLSLLFKSGTQTCAQVATLPIAGGGVSPPNPDSSAPPPAVPPAPPQGTPDECRREAKKWEQAIRRGLKGRQHSPGYTLLVFMDNGALCHANRTHGIQGDPIFIGVYSPQRNWSSPLFEPCSVEPTGPALFVGADKLSLSGKQTEAWSLTRMPSQFCYNASVAISLQLQPPARDGVVQPAQTAIRYTLNQSQVYRGTVQLGALFTTQHSQEYDVRLSADGPVIYNKGPTGRGVAYTASLVLYGIPRYVQDLVGGPTYTGRDLVHDQGLLDRIGLVLGVGLTDPGRRFIAGGSFELLYGVNVIGVAEVFRATELAGQSVGDPVIGIEEVKTRDRWKTRPTFGLTVDLLYARELFSGRISP